MDLKDLNNQQLILLALLVSFITSIATGIVTVTLMDQAPPGVTQTINRIVKETVKVITPEGKAQEISTEKIVVKEEDFIIDAAQKNSANVVRMGVISEQEGFRIGGLELPAQQVAPSFKASGGSGFIISTDGLLVTDKKLVQGSKRYAIETLDGTVFEAKVLEEGEHVALLQIVTGEVMGTTTVPQPKFSQVKLGNSDEIKIGQTTIALGIDTNISLLLGVVSRVERRETPISEKVGEEPQKTIGLLYTTMAATPSYSGGPLINTEVEVIGINIIMAGGEQFSAPSNEVKKLLDIYRTKVGKEAKENITP